jgi:hypothetical protein
VDSVTVLVTGGSPQDWHGRAAIKRRNDGVLVMCYRDGSAHDVNDGALHIRFSDDDGATWTAADTTLGDDAVTNFPMNPATLSAGQDAGEPWLYHYDDDDFLILHMWRIDYGVSMGGTYQATSSDGGETWTTATGPVQFAGLTPTQNGKTFATDDDFYYDGVLYAGARVYNDADGVPSSMVLITTDDKGATWTRLSTIMSATEDGGKGGQEVGLEYLGDGRIIAMIRDNPQVKAFRRFSDDMGVTWGTLTDMTSEIGIAARQRVYTRAHLKGYSSWWADPVLIMCGFDHTSPGYSQGRINAVWISTDAGLSWTSPFYVETGTYGDGGYGDLFYDVGNDQYVFVSYRGTLAAADLVQYRLTISNI